MSAREHNRRNIASVSSRHYQDTKEKVSRKKITQQLISQSPHEMEVLLRKVSSHRETESSALACHRKTTDAPAILFQMEKFLE